MQVCTGREALGSDLKSGLESIGLFREIIQPEHSSCRNV